MSALGPESAQEAARAARGAVGVAPVLQRLYGVQWTPVAPVLTGLKSITTIIHGTWAKRSPTQTEW